MTDPVVPSAQPVQPGGVQPATYPGKTLGIVAVIVAIFFSLIGFILGLVARSQSKAAGYKNTPATAAIIIGIVLFVLGIIFWFSVGASIFNLCNSGQATCTTTN
jgi:uncharacterized membrane protein